MEKQHIHLKNRRYKSLTRFPVSALLVFFLLTAGMENSSYGQTATALWALTANSSVAVTGNITATPLIPGTGLGTTTYNATNGATASNFNGAICTPNVDDFFEFDITATCGNDLTVASVSFDYRASTVTVSRCLQLKYAVNGGAESQIGGNITVSSTTPTNYNTGTISITVPAGQVLRLRIYGAANSTAVSLSVRNFTMNGNTVPVTSPAPGVSIVVNPAFPVCPGDQVAFTATPVNGGTAPSYQWQVNGTNAGTNSTVFATTTLADGDQVTCVITSNLTCVSPSTATSNSITAVLSPTTLPAPGAITGTTPVPIHSTGLFYGIAAVPNATAYNWTVPDGWTITSGAGTTGITVTAGGAGTNGNITVTAVNLCASSLPSILAVAVIPPHNDCNQCHITHTSPGMTLTNTVGNANLCMSCHNTNGSASLFPFSNAMKATPGVSGNSHNWDQAAVNATYETNAPSDAQMALRLPNNQIICSTCHNQHNPLTNLHYLRSSNTGDAICKDCHSARNVGTYASNPSIDKGSHPVGIAYNPSDPRFLPAPVAPIQTVSSKVECNSCHQTHYAASSDGNLLRETNGNGVCTSCHIYKTADITLDHEGMTCKTCHYTHNPDKSNILMVRNSIATPNSGLQSVVFSANASASDYADASAPFNGVCEVCHTSTDHYTNTSGGTADARHVPATQKCVTCHPHNKAFYAMTNCLDCHNTVQDKPGVGPPGGRRQIVDNTANGFGTGGDFIRTSHHVHSAVPNASDCVRCHYMGDHMRGTVKLLDPDLGFLNVITYDPLNKASVETFCVKCHDANGANGNMKPFSDSVSVPFVDGNMWNNSAHKTALTCLDCHDNGHGSNKSVMLGPFDYTGPGTGSDLMNEEEGFCLNCHGASGTASVKVHLAFSSYANNTTDFYKHDPANTYRVHSPYESAGSAFTGANRHVECVDCHNPHGAIAGTATAPALLPTMTGATGVEPSYTGIGAPTGFTWQQTVTQEYQVCYKCHSSFTTLSTYLPSGWDGSALVPDGLKKLTTGGTNSQVPEARDIAQDYNPSNQGFHPVMAAGKNIGINAATFKPGWSYTSRVYCSSCHNNPKSATPGMGRGPHGSQNLHILDQATPGAAAVNFKTDHNNSVLASPNDVCGKCHQANSYWTGHSNSRFPYHDSPHMNDQSAECYVCHNSHGGEQFHMINFDRNVPACLTAASPNTTSAFGYSASSSNSCTITCHGQGHSATINNYTPAYP